ncbi:MAG: cob(I)yrinic acid a,c-diamide adenosyltransferase [Candidatus Thermoplasmatota archaeon]|nr:cob(I)yrinic acid a,c-diamide adenosyltransferase [Candidatus Thermoplasmatota archaeon]
MTEANQLGRVHVITGPGKGKTTAAFGQAMRAAGHGIRVCIVQFMKTGETTGEAVAAKHIPEIELVQFGTGRFVDPRKVSADDIRCAKEALAHVRAVLSKHGCGLLIMDEVNVAVSFGLLEAKEVIELLDTRGEGVEVVLTGRNAPLEFIDYADYVSVIDSWKHPFDGRDGKSRKGIEW